MQWLQSFARFIRDVINAPIHPAGSTSCAQDESESDRHYREMLLRAGADSDDDEDEASPMLSPDGHWPTEEWSEDSQSTSWPSDP